MLVRRRSAIWFISSFSLASEYFDKALNGGFTKSQNNSIHFEEDDPDAVALLVAYLYRGAIPEFDQQGSSTATKVSDNLAKDRPEDVFIPFQPPDSFGRSTTSTYTNTFPFSLGMSISHPKKFGSIITIIGRDTTVIKLRERAFLDLQT